MDKIHVALSFSANFDADCWEKINLTSNGIYLKTLQSKRDSSAHLALYGMLVFNTGLSVPIKSDHKSCGKYIS